MDPAPLRSRRRTARRLLGAAAALAVLLGLGLYRVAAEPGGGSTLVVLTSWTDPVEASAFQAVVDAFTARCATAYWLGGRPEGVGCGVSER